MGIPQQFSSLTCQLRIIQAKNIEVKSAGNLFVRYYLSAGNNKRIQLNSQQISSKSDLYCWDESFSLSCFGNEESMHSLEQQSVVFELRCRKNVPVLGRIGRSQLLARVEIPWQMVLESPNMEFDQWVTMVPSSSDRRRVHGDGDVKPPALQLQMKVVLPAMLAETERTKRYNRLKKWDECGCGCQDGGCSCADYDIFAFAAAFEAL